MKVGVIPARLSSTRLAEKLILDLGGQSILERTFRRAKQAKLLDDLVIATDSTKIFDLALAFGAKVFMTGEHHQSGTDRIAELVHANPSWTHIVNIQGDEPFIDPAQIDLSLSPFLHDAQIQMVSLSHEINKTEAMNPNNVKVVLDNNSFALYFSRSLIPYVRDSEAQEPSYKKHIGLYAYRRDIILQLASLPMTPLERLEKLEQLRALENGYRIKILEVQETSLSIDTPEDYQQALTML